jgi:hypothetical protein
LRFFIPFLNICAHLHYLHVFQRVRHITIS